MKVRIKFSKNGPIKFVGHLDTMRYFQKAIRRAGLPIRFTEGFSPHMVMSFAAPLGVGITSNSEYFDMELTQEMSSREIEDRLNETMAEGFHVLSARRVEDGKTSKAMSLVAASDYIVEFRSGREPSGWEEALTDFYGQSSIVVMKKTKRSEKEVDIKPYIYSLEARDHKLYMQLAAGSSNNTKPDLVVESLAAYLHTALEPYAYMVHKEEVYADIGDETHRNLISLEALGEIIE